MHAHKVSQADDLAADTAKTASAPLPVDVMRVEKSSTIQTLALPGETAGWYNAMEEFKKVVAPYDGVITQRRIDIGDLVSAGHSSNDTPLYMIAQADKIRTFVDVPQHVARGITVGMAAEITADQFPDRKFLGKVARTSNAINSASRTLRVEVDIPNTDLALMPGMYVRTTFQLTQGSLLQVPASAVLFRQAGPEVAVVGDDNHVKFHTVTIAHDEGDVVQIGAGLQINDRVALNISSEVADGDTVSPQDSGEIPVPSAALSKR
jgi:RND family efflux transporter MFP subunit